MWLVLCLLGLTSFFFVIMPPAVDLGQDLSLTQLAAAQVPKFDANLFFLRIFLMRKIFLSLSIAKKGN